MGIHRKKITNDFLHNLLRRKSAKKKRIQKPQFYFKMSLIDGAASIITNPYIESTDAMNDQSSKITLLKPDLY